jgi:predicted CXXCH cytochrome family protein
MKNMNLIKVVLLLAAPGLVTLANAAGIGGSLHDFTAESWNVNKDVCGPCHMAHGSNPNDQGIPLWSRGSLTVGPFQPYVSPHGTAIPTPDGASLACLSCHDGTLAYNQLKGEIVGSTVNKVLGDYVIGGGGDLRGDHPISFVYQDAVNASPTNTLKLATETLGGAYNPGNNTGGTLPLGNNLQGQSLGSAFLKGSKMQCNSCHDVHRSVGDSGLNSDAASFISPNHNPLLVVFNGGGRLDQSGLGSSLCRS